jgi:acyl-coenzyme A thioesterase PaaI-like protein
VQRIIQSHLCQALWFTSTAVFAFLASLAYYPVKAGVQVMVAQVVSDEETLALFEPADEFARGIDQHIKTHLLSQELRADPELFESRGHLNLSETLRLRNLTAGTLAGPNKIVVPPYVWCDKEGRRMVSIFYLGSEVSGYPDIVHGGLLATLLDEGMGRCCFTALPNRVGVTANLNIDYRRLVPVDTYVVLKAETIKVEGRKAWVEGRIESLPTVGEDAIIFVEGKALFIEPKLATVRNPLPIH